MLLTYSGHHLFADGCGVPSHLEETQNLSLEWSHSSWAEKVPNQKRQTTYPLESALFTDALLRPGLAPRHSHSAGAVLRR